MAPVGQTIMEVMVRIAADGEIRVRGELVMYGYCRNDAETARVLKQGWLHTGDVGHLDDRGRLVITDRKNELIVNDKSDTVAPQQVEGILPLKPELFPAMVQCRRRTQLLGVADPVPAR